MCVAWHFIVFAGDGDGVVQILSCGGAGAVGAQKHISGMCCM